MKINISSGDNKLHNFDAINNVVFDDLNELENSINDNSKLELIHYNIRNVSKTMIMFVSSWIS